MKEKDDLVERCYLKLDAAIKEKQDTATIFELAANFAGENDLSIAEMFNKVKNAYHKEKYRKKVEEPRFENIYYIYRELQKQENNRIISLKEGNLYEEDEKKAVEAAKLKENYHKYYLALMSAYILLMPLDMALEQIASEQNLSVEDIKKFGEIYIMNYADSIEKVIARQKQEKLAKALKENGEDVQAKICAHKIIKILKNTRDNQEKEIRGILQNADIKVLCRVKNIIVKYFTNILNGVSDKDARSICFNQEGMIIDIIVELNAQKQTNNSVKYVNECASTRRKKILEEFLNKNMTLEDYYSYYTELTKAKLTPKDMKKILSEASIECGRKDELTIHIQKMYEFEKEYLEKVIDYICYYLRNGVPIDENNRRDFTIIDYHGITSYPLEKLKVRTQALNLISKENYKMFMTFVNQNSTKGKKVLKIKLENILNELEISRQFGSTFRNLTQEEKCAIYYYLKDYNIPMTYANFNTVMSEYAQNRLFLAKR